MAQKYLRDKIDEAKQETGYAKVDVVAHSMGGLLTRAYIQNKGFEESLDGYRDDIDRFVMVGTPNHGSANVYPIREGGEPLISDYLGGTKVNEEVRSLPNPNYFYTRTADKLYAVMKGENLARSTQPGGEPKVIVERKTIRDFVEEYISSTSSLMPAGGKFRLLQQDGSFTSYSNNSWLDDLNADLPNLNNNSNSHFAPKRALLDGIEGFLGSIGGCVTHSCSAFSARRSQATCFWGPLGSFRAH